MILNSFKSNARNLRHDGLPPTRSESTNQGEFPRQIQQTILAVNDMPDLLEAMSVLLRKSGYRVVPASDGTEALELAQREHPDLVVSDVAMPGMDGIELCSRIRADSELRKTAVLLVSAIRKDSDSVAQGLIAGADDYLEAPYEPLHLVKKVARIIERRQAEEKIKEAEERYRAVVETARDVIVTIDANGTILSINRSVERVFGYRVAEVLGKLVTILVPKRRRFAFKAALNKYSADVEKDPNYGALELTGESKTGQEIPLELSIGEFVKNGRRFLTGIARDISERKRAEQELRKSEERYREIVENAHDIIYSHDLEGNYTSINRAGEQITGYTREEVLKLTLANTVAPECLEKAQEMLRRKLAGETVTAYELEIIAKDGRRIPVEVNTRLVLHDGVPEGVQGIARDITERKRAEEGLRESEERYRLLFESNPQPMWVYDLETLAFLAINQAAVRHYRYSREEFLGMTIKDIHPEEDIPALVASVRNGSSGVDSAGPCRHRMKDGSIIEVEVTAHPLVFDGRRANLIVANDVTEQKRLRAALLLSEEQLRQSQKLEAIGQLAGGVAHDFNNLLTAINGYSALALQRLGRDHPIASYLNEIERAGNRAADLTRQLLAFGRKQLLQPLSLSLNDIVTDMSKMLTRLIGESITFETKLSPNLKRIKVDPGQVEQVLMNLVVNARDAMPRGGVLTIETKNEELDDAYASKHISVKPGQYVMLAVSDTGMGMGQEVQAHIFEPFYTTKEKGKGTGLGLSTVYGIIKQSGGNIWLYSEPGKGTSFKVYLPVTEDEIETSVAPTADTSSQRGSETVLLVEDEEIVRKITKRLLEENGYNVLQAGSGEEAIRVFTRFKEPIHLLITDVVMPMLSGKDVADQIESVHPETKVLYMSGYTDEAIVHHGIVDADIEFIQKPFTERGLTRKIREILDSESPPRAK